VARHRGVKRSDTAPGPARVAWRRVVPWPVAAVFAGVGTAAAGWLICLALCMGGWLSAPGQPVDGPLRLSAALFVLANGGPVAVGGVPVSIVPLGLTLVIVAAGVGLTRLALRNGFPTPPGSGTRRVALVAGAVALAYVAADVAAMVETGAHVVGRGPLGALVVGAIIGWASAAPLFGWRVTWHRISPAWVKAGHRSLGAGLGVWLGGAAVALAVALITSHARIGSLAAGLDTGVWGGVVLTVVQSLWLVNLVIWAGAWVTGAGFALGSGTIVSPVAVQLGVLPSVPVFGAAPDAGVPNPAMPVWLVVPVLAGVAAAWVSVRAQATSARLAGETLRPDVGGLIGGATGIATGLVATALAAVSGGDLGLVRLVGLGPRLGAMVLLAPTCMGFAGVAAGVLLAWRWGVVGKAAAPAPVEPVEAPTVELSPGQPVPPEQPVPPGQPTAPRPPKPPTPARAPRPPKPPTPPRHAL